MPVAAYDEDLRGMTSDDVIREVTEPTSPNPYDL